MARSQKPRRAYRPGAVHLNALERTLNGVRKITPTDVIMQRQVLATALQEFCAGKHCQQHWCSLADATNMAETFCGMGLGSGPNAEIVISQAQAVLAAVAARHKARNSWTLYAVEIEQLTWLAALHGQQLSACDYSEFCRALSTTKNRLSQARQGNAPVGAYVVIGAMQ
jgi:hypothetical protein